MTRRPSRRTRPSARKPSIPLGTGMGMERDSVEMSTDKTPLTKTGMGGVGIAGTSTNSSIKVSPTKKYLTQSDVNSILQQFKQKDEILAQDVINTANKYGVSRNQISNLADIAYRQKKIQEQNEEIWQKKMDSAYDKWQQLQQSKGDSVSMETWFDTLSEEEQETVALGKLNQQVDNGGFYQYYDNGYYEVMHSSAKRAINKMEDSPEKRRMKAILNDVEDVIQESGSEDKYSQRDWDESYDDEDTKTIYEDLSRFDDQWYDIDNRMEVMARYVTKYEGVTLTTSGPSKKEQQRNRRTDTITLSSGEKVNVTSFGDN